MKFLIIVADDDGSSYMWARQVIILLLPINHCWWFLYILIFAEENQKNWLNRRKYLNYRRMRKNYGTISGEINSTDETVKKYRGAYTAIGGIFLASLLVLTFPSITNTIKYKLLQHTGNSLIKFQTSYLRPYCLQLMSLKKLVHMLSNLRTKISKWYRLPVIK